jgi:hypothetical protein
VAKVTVTIETPERVLRTALTMVPSHKHVDRHTLVLIVAHQETEVKEVKIEAESPVPRK